MTILLIIGMVFVLLFVYLNMARIRLDEEVAAIKKEEKQHMSCKSSTECFENGLAHYKRCEYEEAYECFSMARRMNHIGATHCLGIMYLDGYGVKQDTERGYELIEEAASWGYAPSKEILSDRYERKAFERAMWDVLPKGEWEIDFS